MNQETLQIQGQTKSPHYAQSEMKVIKYIAPMQEKERLVCPECITHHQGDPATFMDCKHTYKIGTDQAGQCACCSAAHGIRLDSEAQQEIKRQVIARALKNLAKKKVKL